MILLNFSHPLSPDQFDRLTALIGRLIERVLAAPAQFDQAQPFGPQAAALIDALALTPEEWQTAPIVVILPSLNFIAASVLAELHGRMGYFPAIVRLRPSAAVVPTRYEVAEVINLQSVRDAARLKR
ncbi:MAG TPA: CRISPR-associated protein Csx15 [Anaerolineae bacterium]